MPDRIIFDADNVDIEKIMEQIHERVKERGYDEAELARLSAELVIPEAPSKSAPLSEYSANVTNAANVQYWWVMPKGNPVKDFIKKVTRKLGYFYLKHTFDQQNIFNANTAAAIAQLTDAVDSLREENSALRKELEIATGMACDKFDYFEFENKFRGSSEDIINRQKKYLPYFSGKQNVLDIGCGRGEFLRLLKSQGISAHGVDISSENIRECRDLDVTCADGIDYLEKLPDNSVGGIFCAQVIEHISTNQLIRLLSLAHKKLADDAVIILETLNPQCLMIYAESMYMDPSHTKPVHPLTVKFMAEHEGFSDTELIYSTPTDAKFLLDDTDESGNVIPSSKEVNSLLFGNREYALVCRK